MYFNKKSIFALGIFICFLICISHVSAYEGVDNSTSLDSAVDNSLSDYNLNPSGVLSVSNPDFANINQDKKLSLMNDDLSHGKLGKHDDKKKEVEDKITVGNFSLLNKELSDFNDNRYYKTIDYGTGHDVKQIFDPTQYNKVHTFNLTRDYKYDDSTDKDFINGINLLISPKNKNLYNDIIINGNGHFIDGNGLASIFKVSGSNVQIVNVTFRNLNTIHNYYHEKEFGSKYPSIRYKSNDIMAPIMWLGDNGKLINCTFTDNTGACGGSLYWTGNEGIIEHNKFINNRAAFLGGFAYIGGKNNDIHDNLAFNCEAMLDGDALYVKNLTSNIVDHMNYFKVNKTNSNFICPDVVDGSLMHIDPYALYTCYVSLDYQCVDITPLVYASLFYGRTYFELDNGFKAFVSYSDVDHVLTLTLSKFCTSTIEIRKTLNIEIHENALTKTFRELISANNVLQIIKHCTINNADDYKEAMGFKASTLKSEYDMFKKATDVDESYMFEKIMTVLDVKFNKTLSIDSSSTWTPKGFDLIFINGANSLIHTKNDQRAEKKFVDWSGDSLFVASNLKVSGFNNAFKNSGAQMFLINMEIFNNKMDYRVDRDYGAGILNLGVVYCTNCTFHNNKAKYGGAIYNQGLLIVTNSSFYSNNGYGKGNDIVNVDDGIVTLDGIEYKKCGGNHTVYMKSMDSKMQTVVKVVCYGGSFILGAIAGFFTANPLIGMAVGAAIGAAAGAIGSAIICSNVYDVNFCRWSCALTLILGSAGAGSLGGSIGGSIGSYFAASASASTSASASASTEVTGNTVDQLATKGSPILEKVIAVKDSMDLTYSEACAQVAELINSGAFNPGITVAQISAANQAAAAASALESFTFKVGEATAHKMLQVLGESMNVIMATTDAATIATAASNIAKITVTAIAASAASANAVTIASTVITTCVLVGAISVSLGVGVLCNPGAIVSYTTHFTKPSLDDESSLISFTSNTYILSSDLITSVKFYNDAQKVNDFIGYAPEKISFTADEVLDAIKSVNLNNGSIRSVLY